MGGSLLRLHFHDCFGCDASVLLDDTTNFIGEKNAAPNKDSVRGYDVIDKIKEELEKECPGVVSCADILAVAARDSVDALRPQPYGKYIPPLFPFPTWRVELGRRDSRTASANNATTDLPSPISNLTGLISSFSRKGFTTQEMVVLSGAHTIGKARCLSFRDHIYNDTNINPFFATSLKRKCPRKAGDGDSKLAPLDVTTKNTFDNNYFRDLVNKKGVLHSDQQLFNNGPTDNLVRLYSRSPQLFLKDFSKAIVKMGRLSPLTGSAGEIRRKCSKRN
ncbi:Peroxidase 52 [Morus notabilis]|uniref:peroxidase n=1 Tax=Morus notabilis TaxID=981085 RepID=W9RWP8_9ROSA|nr:Peroxidase 52 [Morus notabilis]